MIERYLETRLRNISAPGLISDMVRHLHARQHLGVAAVITTDPEADCLNAQRQWHKLTRALQDKRVSTMAAEDILRLTSTISHMQRMKFVAGRPGDNPGAQVYFVDGIKPGLLPNNCFSAYIISAPADFEPAELIRSLSAGALVVDYVGLAGVSGGLLRPRAELERNLAASWRKMSGFLTANGVSVGNLSLSVDQSMSASDGALDTVLSCAAEFSLLADDFLRDLGLARPLKSVSKQTRNQYEDLVRLVSRVDSLTPGPVNDRALDVDFDDSFALRESKMPFALFFPVFQETYVAT